jgi:hypothetical protein
MDLNQSKVQDILRRQDSRVAAGAIVEDSAWLALIIHGPDGCLDLGGGESGLTAGIEVGYKTGLHQANKIRVGSGRGPSQPLLTPVDESLPGGLYIRLYRRMR